MAEHWKSTPRYWCKHCSIFVRDTKLERQNHESTAKHQGNLKRFLRDLHRGHEKEEREKDRARQEIARVSGVVSGSSSGPTTASTLQSTSTQNAKPGAPSEAQLKKQREQLAELGVAMPSDFRPEMAMPGEWTVTNTRVIKDDAEQDEEAKFETKATGVRKREATEDDKEHEEAINGLFKKPRKWGRNTKLTAQEEDKGLDALLSGSMVTRTSDNDETKRDTDSQKQEVKDERGKAVKVEPDGEPQGLTASVKTETGSGVPMKSEDQGSTPAGVALAEDAPAEAAPAVVFKKRKPKTLRQK